VFFDIGNHSSAGFDEIKKLIDLKEKMFPINILYHVLKLEVL
jgi:hypothetical protein